MERSDSRGGTIEAMPADDTAVILEVEPAEALRGGFQTRSFGPGEPPGFSGSLGPQRNSRNFLSAGENALP
jgi:hypothetical protein